ncbi:MAG: CBS domain-containing protein [Rickettsiaceae bacterium]|nr:CBS domain-containing protein [Rickettsiaceae bacterium]
MQFINNFFNNIISFITKKTLKAPFYNTFQQLQHKTKEISPFEKEILDNFFKIIPKQIDDIMVPRSDICAVSIEVEIDELSETVKNKGHTRLIVYRDTLDDIVGFVHIKDLYAAVSSDKKFNIRNIIRKPLMVVKSMGLLDLLREMQKHRTHIACVVDEYGGTDGLVTMEDVVSELIGPIEDEHEAIHVKKRNNYEIINDNTLIISGRMELEELEKLIAIKLFDEEVDDFNTVSGLILAKAGCMPNLKEVVQLNDRVKAEIIAKDQRSIKKVKIMLEML